MSNTERIVVKYSGDAWLEKSSNETKDQLVSYKKSKKFRGEYEILRKIMTWRYNQDMIKNALDKLAFIVDVVPGMENMDLEVVKKHKHLGPIQKNGGYHVLGNQVSYSLEKAGYLNSVFTGLVKVPTRFLVRLEELAELAGRVSDTSYKLTVNHVAFTFDLLTNASYKRMAINYFKRNQIKSRFFTEELIKMEMDAVDLVKRGQLKDIRALAVNMLRAKNTDVLCMFPHSGRHHISNSLNSKLVPVSGSSSRIVMKYGNELTRTVYVDDEVAMDFVEDIPLDTTGEHVYRPLEDDYWIGASFMLSNRHTANLKDYHHSSLNITVPFKGEEYDLLYLDALNNCPEFGKDGLVKPLDQLNVLKKVKIDKKHGQRDFVSYNIKSDDKPRIHMFLGALFERSHMKKSTMVQMMGIALKNEGVIKGLDDLNKSIKAIVGAVKALRKIEKGATDTNNITSMKFTGVTKKTAQVGFGSYHGLRFIMDDTVDADFTVIKTAVANSLDGNATKLDGKIKTAMSDHMKDFEALVNWYMKAFPSVGNIKNIIKVEEKRYKDLGLTDISLYSIFFNVFVFDVSDFISAAYTADIKSKVLENISKLDDEEDEEDDQVVKDDKRDLQGGEEDSDNEEDLFGSAFKNNSVKSIGDAFFNGVKQIKTFKVFAFVGTDPKDEKRHIPYRLKPSFYYGLPKEKTNVKKNVDSLDSKEAVDTWQGFIRSDYNAIHKSVSRYLKNATPVQFTLVSMYAFTTLYKGYIETMKKKGFPVPDIYVGYLGMKVTSQSLIFTKDRPIYTYEKSVLTEEKNTLTFHKLMNTQVANGYAMKTNSIVVFPHANIKKIHVPQMLTFFDPSKQNGNYFNTSKDKYGANDMEDYDMEEDIDDIDDESDDEMAGNGDDVDSYNTTKPSLFACLAGIGSGKKIEGKPFTVLDGFEEYTSGVHNRPKYLNYANTSRIKIWAGLTPDVLPINNTFKVGDRTYNTRTLPGTWKVKSKDGKTVTVNPKGPFNHHFK